MPFSEIAPCFGVWEGKPWWIAFSSFSLWDSLGPSNNCYCHLWVTVVLSPKICTWLITLQGEGSTTSDSFCESTLSNRMLAAVGDSLHWAVPTIFQTQHWSRAQSKRQSHWGHSSNQPWAPSETGCTFEKGKHMGHRRQMLQDLGKSWYYIWGLRSSSFWSSAESPAFSLFLEQSNTAAGKVCSICSEAEDVRSTVLQSEAEGIYWVRKIVPKPSAFPPAYVVQIFLK